MRLLEPLPLRGDVVAPNRILFGPHETNLGRGRAIGDRHLAYYERRMAGGVGMLVTEHASAHPSDWPYERAPLAAECGPGWRAIADAATNHGTVALAGIGHDGGQGASAYSQRELWAPSGVPEVNTREVPKVMEDDDIAAVVSGFGEAARLAVSSGLHGVEVNAGQHSLIRQFLSGLTNTRGDAYGTDKLRFAREVLHAVRVGAGEDAVVGLRLSCDEMAPWAGIVPEAAAEIAVALVPWIDYLVVVRGAIFSVPATRPDGHDQPGFNLDLTGQIRAAVLTAGSGTGAVPVFAQGSIVEWGQAEWAVSEGRCDGVEMTRAQLADADLVTKLHAIAAGDPDRIRPCILCNQTCKVRDNRNPIVTCVVDPRTGHELADPDLDAARPGGHGRATADVLVVGGGVAGLEAARVAALRGHAVELREQHEALGGMTTVAARGAGRDRLGLIVDWLGSECGHLGVKVQTGTPVTFDDLAAATEAGTHVVVATGSTVGTRAYDVTDGATVLDAATVLAQLPDLAPPDGPTVVWDPIGGPVAVSIAESLRAGGHEVHLVTPDNIVGTLLSRSGDLAPANTRLQAAGVVLHKRSLLRAVGAATATVEDTVTGERRDLAAALVIDGGHRLPDPTLAAHAPGAGPGRTAVAGDAVAPRTIHEAILEARRAVLEVEAAR